MVFKLSRGASHLPQHVDPVVSVLMNWGGLSRLVVTCFLAVSVLAFAARASVAHGQSADSAPVASAPATRAPLIDGADGVLNRP